MNTICTILLLLLCPAALYSQLFTQRTNIVRHSHDTTTIGEAFGATHYAIDFARGFGSLGGEQAWNGKFIGCIDFYRWVHQMYCAAYFPVNSVPILIMILPLTSSNNMGASSCIAAWQS
jgi:hypothetical protein